MLVCYRWKFWFINLRWNWFSKNVKSKRLQIKPDLQYLVFFLRWDPKLSPQQCLSVFLIWERNKHERSAWFPYLHVLPSYFTTPAYFTHTELTYLPKAVRYKAQHECEKLKKGFHDLTEFSSRHWNEFYKILTFDVYRWAWYVINSRSVFYQSEQSEYLSTDEPDTLALAPFLDLLNHSPTADVSFYFF